MVFSRSLPLDALQALHHEALRHHLLTVVILQESFSRLDGNALSHAMLVCKLWSVLGDDTSSHRPMLRSVVGRPGDLDRLMIRAGFTAAPRVGFMFASMELDDPSLLKVFPLLFATPGHS